jgi:hypothetical protein
MFGQPLTYDAKKKKQPGELAGSIEDASATTRTQTTSPTTTSTAPTGPAPSPLTGSQAIAPTVTGTGVMADQASGGVPLIGDDGALTRAAAGEKVTGTTAAPVSGGQTWGGGSADAATADAGPKSIEDLAEEHVRRYLEGGQDDTAAEEALLSEQMDRRLGQGLVDQRARMGRAGFGASGALAAIEGDTRRQAALDAAERMFGVREREQAQQYDRGQGVIGTDIDLREQASKEGWRQAQADALAALLGGETGAPAADTGAGGGPIDSLDRAINAGATQDVAGPPQPSEYDSLPRARTPPEDGEVVYAHGISGPGSYTIYRTRGEGGAYEYVRVDGR